MTENGANNSGVVRTWAALCKHSTCQRFPKSLHHGHTLANEFLHTKENSTSNEWDGFPKGCTSKLIDVTNTHTQNVTLDPLIAGTLFI